MQLRTIASLAVAIFLGLIAVLLVRGILSNQKSATVAAAAGAGQTAVVVAAQPIDRGLPLKAPMLKVVNYPSGAVPPGAFTSPEQLVGKGVEVRTALRSFAVNEPILAAKLSGEGSKLNLSGALAPGMRAISVRSNDVSGVGGFVLPGDRVDVLITRQAGDDANSSTITQALAENVRVLGIDQTSDQDSDKPMVAKAVTIEVTPEQAQSISLGQAVGQVTLSLRQVADGAPLAKRVTSVADLGGGHGAGATRLAGGAAPRAARPKVIAAAQTGLAEVRVTRGVETAGYSVKAY